mmetsp:Transcript_89834/g.159794  ORF Transcript_89834/g.159794 Transcript_89834/m.159794 type:complete len:572 (-) Transcript_89834:127-1842(-)
MLSVFHIILINVLLCFVVVESTGRAKRTLSRIVRRESDDLPESNDGITVLPSTDMDAAVVPAPALIYRMPGSITLPSEMRVRAPPKLLQAFRKHAHKALMPVADDEIPHVLLELSNRKDEHGDEGYMLQVRKDGVTMEASSEHGLFNGIMTFRQLSKKGADGRVSLPLVHIQDKPAFLWRGMMLDVSRHFFPVADVKHLLNTMAFFKMNRFHWHLTDDQGWRVPIEKYPRLTKVGGMRQETQRGHDETLTVRKKYNHSYSTDEIDDIIQHAESLFIDIVPEVDMPGHTEAAIAAYPQLGNVDTEFFHPEVQPHFGAFNYTLSPRKRTAKFQKDVLSELVLLFANSEFIHLGGDEVKTEQWEKSSSATEISLAEDTDVVNLEATFVERAAKHVHQFERHAVIWDEALSTPNLPKDTVVMLWRNWGSGFEDIGSSAAAKNLSVVLAPQTFTYLDQFQSEDHSSEPYDAHGGFLPLQQVYNMPLEAGPAKILGMQAQLWSEYINKGRKNMDYMAWPRGAALAEVAWAGKARPGFKDFEERLQHQLTSLKDMDVNYRPVTIAGSPSEQDEEDPLS